MPGFPKISVSLSRRSVFTRRHWKTRHMLWSSAAHLCTQGLTPCRDVGLVEGGSMFIEREGSPAESASSKTKAAGFPPKGLKEHLHRVRRTREEHGKVIHRRSNQ